MLHLPSSDCFLAQRECMQTLIFTGPVGVTARAAAVTAAAAAQAGSRVLLASVGPAHPVASLLGVASAVEPHPVGPNLDLWCIDPLEDLSKVWGAIRSGGNPTITGDELPVIPGSDLFLAVTGLQKYKNNYDLVCADAGPPETLLRSLGAPDTFRWFVRLLIGLDRGPGRSSASVARAIIPTALLPISTDWLGRIQDARVQLERMRDEMVNAQVSRVRYVLPPDRSGLAEARLNIPALQLFGLAVESLVAAPLMPTGVAELEPMVAEQQAVMEEAGTIWQGRPVYGLPIFGTPDNLGVLMTLGSHLYNGDSPLPGAPPATPIRLIGLPDPQVALDLPGLPRELLGLTLSGDELIIRAGPYRRHLLMPEGLRGITAIRASRQGETLIIRPRKETGT